MKDTRSMYLHHLKKRVDRAEYPIDAESVAAAILRRLRERSATDGPRDLRETARLLSGEVVEAE
jgi:hypothetical protein